MITSEKSKEQLLIELNELKQKLTRLYKIETEQSLLVKKLHASEVKFRTLFESTRDAVMLIDERHIIECNEVALEIFDFPDRREFLGRHLSDLSPPTQPTGEDSRILVDAHLKHAFRGNRQFFEWIYRRRDGAEFPSEVLLSRMELDGKIFFVIIRDITERKSKEKELKKHRDHLDEQVKKHTAELTEMNEESLREIMEHRRAEKALRESEANLKRAQEVAHIGCWRLDLMNDNLWWSEEIFRMFGVTTGLPLTYEKFLETVHPDDRNLVDTAWKSAMQGEPYDIEHRIVVAGEVKWMREMAEIELDPKGVPISGAGTVQDITQWKLAEKEREKLQAQLVQAQKMEAIGTLAGGIAHDFNNILSAIVGYSELSLYTLSEDHPARRKISQVLVAADRAKDLVQQILSFSRRTEQEQKPCQLALIVKEALKMMRAILPTTIEIRYDGEAASDTVLADPTQIHQVVMNLCTNAAHAMQDTGGVLEVSLGRLDLEPESAGEYIELEAGRYQRLTICDSGHGMGKHALDRIFEPFFTTKERGEGTGLGLSVAHGIVKSHGGTIKVYSEPGIGSTFHVYLPLLETDATHRITHTKAPLPRGVEHILFVDDEHGLAELGIQMLDHLGYQVTAETSSLKALEKFKAAPERFDLVITDMTMPQMTGLDLAEELLRIRPNLRIILCTGFSPKISDRKFEASGISHLLMKPLVLREVAETIREVLDETEE